MSDRSLAAVDGTSWRFLLPPHPETRATSGSSGCWCGGSVARSRCGLARSSACSMRSRNEKRGDWLHSKRTMRREYLEREAFICTQSCALSPQQKMNAPVSSLTQSLSCELVRAGTGNLLCVEARQPMASVPRSRAVLPKRERASRST